jgi:hypothetical protein
MLPTKADNLAFSVLRDIYEVPEAELSGVDPTAFGERIRTIHKGLSAENEFAAIASWLGRCSLLTHPDEVLHTDGTYGVPDFLIVVHRGAEKIAFLVEVKTKEEDRLVWSKKYRTKMRKFADLLGMPLLVAWRRHGLWLLNDAALFEKREKAYHLTFDAALKSNLMGMLFGNVWIKLKEGFRMELKMEILDSIDEQSGVVPEGAYRCIIREAAFYTTKGEVPKDLSSGLFPLLLAKAAEPRIERESRFLRHIFPTDPEGMFNSSDLLFANLSWGRPDDQEIDWKAEISKGLPVPTIALRESLRHALEAGAIQYVFDQQPEIVPPFLTGWTWEEAGKNSN